MGHRHGNGAVGMTPHTGRLLPRIPGTFGGFLALPLRRRSRRMPAWARRGKAGVTTGGASVPSRTREWVPSGEGTRGERAAWRVDAGPAPREEGRYAP